jgi:predicted AlkP superfamily pyrophosphatase or phosphodiesterase
MNRLKLVFLLLPLIFPSCKNVDTSIYDYTQDCFLTENITSLHVFLIGIDGWGAHSLPKANMPTIKRMMAKGAYTLSAMDVFPSISAPNWVSMFTGSKPVFYGYTNNTGRMPTFQSVVVDEYGYFPNIFTLLKKMLPNCKIASFYEWGGIEDFYPLSVTDKHQNISDLSSNNDAVDTIIDYIKTIKNQLLTFTFIHFDGADHEGHSNGFNSPEYYVMLNKIDGLIKKIEDEIVVNNMISDTIFIFSADHGGINKGHGGNTREEREIPLILYGKNIKSGAIITESMNIYDIAPTISELFGLSKPNVWAGTSFLDIVKESPAGAKGGGLNVGL